MMTIATALAYLDRQLLPIAKQSISASLGWGEMQYATIISSGQAAAAIALLLGGGLVDRLSIRWGPAMLVGAGSLAAACTGLAFTLGQHIAARVAMSGAQVLAVPAFLKASGAILPHTQLAMAIGLATAAGAAGAIAAPLLVPQLTGEWGWRAAFVIAGTAGVVWACGWLVLAKPSPGKGLQTSSKPPQAISIARLAKCRTLWGLAGAKTMSDATWWLLLFWLPDLFIRDFGLAESELGSPLALIYSLSAVGSLLAGTASGYLLRKGFGLERVRYSAMLVSSLGVTVLPTALWADKPMIAALLIGLAMAAHQGFSVNLFALFAETAPAQLVGRYTSLSIFCGNLGGMVVTMVTGLLLSAQWGYAPLLIASPLCYIAALVWLKHFIPRNFGERSSGHADRAALAA
jgi:ACS family hexuronate transporter-like MFS transporter